MSNPAKTSRTLIGDYILKDEESGEQRRYKRGSRLEFGANQLARAIEAGVVHADDKRDAEIPVNDPQGEMDDESKGSPPVDAAHRPASRRRRGR